MFSGPFSLGGSVQGSPPGYLPVQGGGASPIEVQNAEAALRQHYPEIGGFTEYGGQGKSPSTNALGFTWNGASNPWWFGQGPMSVESLLNNAPPPSAGATDPPNPPPAMPPGPTPPGSGIAGSPLEFGDRGGDIGVPGQAPAGAGTSTTSAEGNTTSDPASTYGGGRGGYTGGFNLGSTTIGANFGTPSTPTSSGVVGDAINNAFGVTPDNGLAQAAIFGGRTALGAAVPALGVVNSVLGAIDSISGTMTNAGRANAMNQATANAVSAHSLGEHDMSPAPSAQMTLDGVNANTNQGPMAEAGITSDQEAVDAANANSADPEVDVTTGTPGIGPPGVDAGIAGQAPGVAGTASGTNAGGNSSGNAPAGSPAAGDPAGTGLADAAAAAAGAGVGVGDSSVICTVLRDRGLMSDALWLADGAFGAELDPAILAGYHVWARPFSRFLRRHDWALRLIAPLALAWARHMAHQRGVDVPDSRIGRVIMVLGLPICRWLGRDTEKKQVMA